MDSIHWIHPIITTKCSVIWYLWYGISDILKLHFFIFLKLGIWNGAFGYNYLTTHKIGVWLYHRNNGHKIRIFTFTKKTSFKTVSNRKHSSFVINRHILTIFEIFGLFSKGNHNGNRVVFKMVNSLRIYSYTVQVPEGNSNNEEEQRLRLSEWKLYSHSMWSLCALRVSHHVIHSLIAILNMQCVHTLHSLNVDYWDRQWLRYCIWDIEFVSLSTWSLGTYPVLSPYSSSLS